MSGVQPPHSQKQCPASPGRQQKARRPPPRLRTKSGCLTCRSRRKKCDEKRSRCTGCSRNGLSCKWPERPPSQSKYPLSTHSDNDQTIQGTCEDDDLLAPVASTAVVKYEGHDNKEVGISSQMGLEFFNWNPLNIASSQAQMLLQYFMQVFVPPLIRPNAHQGFFDHSYMIHLTLDSPLLMDAFLCCSALRLSFTQKHLLPEALRYYSSAVNNTRRMIDNGEINGTEDWLIVMVIFLCLFERWQNGSSKAIVHLQGAGQLFALKKARFRDRPELITPFHRIYAESILYNTTISVFLSDEIPSHKVVWSQIGHCFEATPYPDASQTANSPVLGVSPKLYCLVLETSCMARNPELNVEEYRRISQIQDALNPWLLPNEEPFKGAWKQDSEPLSPRLYAMATDILLSKMMSPLGDDSDPQIQIRVQQGLEILDKDDLSEFQAHNICWPILILGCAAVHENDYMSLLQRLEKTWNRSGMGDSKRSIDILKLVWQKRKTNLQSGKVGYGTDIFLRRPATYEVKER